MSVHLKASVPLLISITLFFSTAVRAQQAWSITGSILTSRGDTPDRPLLITLQFRGSPIATAFSDSEGKFSFSELSPNPYRVVVNDDQYLPVDQPVEINPLIPPPVFVQLRLSPRQNNSAFPNSAFSVSSRQLREIPKDAHREFERGNNAEKAGNKLEALEHYKKAIDYASAYLEARNRLGSLLLANSEFTGAQAQFEEILRQDPNFVAAYMNLGNAFLLQQKYVEAVHWVGEGLIRQPNDPFGHFLVGSAFGYLGRTEVAEKELRRSLELNPMMSNSHLALASLYIREKRNNDAADELHTFLKSFPNDPLAVKARQTLENLHVGQ
jgi:tetratricopeptide (TPR) repeat protein